MWSSSRVLRIFQGSVIPMPAAFLPLMMRRRPRGTPSLRRRGSPAKGVPIISDASCGQPAAGTNVPRWRSGKEAIKSPAGMSEQNQRKSRLRVWRRALPMAASPKIVPIPGQPEPGPRTHGAESPGWRSSLSENRRITERMNRVRRTGQKHAVGRHTAIAGFEKEKAGRFLVHKSFPPTHGIICPGSKSPDCAL